MSYYESKSQKHCFDTASEDKTFIQLDAVNFPVNFVKFLRAIFYRASPVAVSEKRGWNKHLFKQSVFIVSSPKKIRGEGISLLKFGQRGGSWKNCS